jgi:hypothetical protein
VDVTEAEFDSSGRQSLKNNDLWFKVTIPYGGKCTKDHILKILMASIAPTVFIPLSYQVRGSKSSFFFGDDFDVAEKLSHVSNRITTYKRLKLLVIVKPGLPHVVIDDTVKAKIKTGMAKRYNVGLKGLDLTQFYKDTDLTDIAIALFRPILLSAVLDIIAENA